MKGRAFNFFQLSHRQAGLEWDVGEPAGAWASGTTRGREVGEGDGTGRTPGAPSQDDGGERLSAHPSAVNHRCARSSDILNERCCSWTVSASVLLSGWGGQILCFVWAQETP